MMSEKKNKKNLILLFLMFVVCTPFAYSNDILIKKINVSGNTKTKTRIILNEIEFKEGDRVSKRRLVIAKRRLLNLNIFSKVQFKLVDQSVLKIHVEERWTTIPIFKLASGGGTSRTTLGVFDPNITGRFIEAGFQFERLEDTNSGVVWFKNPRVGGKRQGFEVQAWKTNRIRIKYDNRIDDPFIKAGFLHSRDKIFFGLNKEIKEFVVVNAHYEYNSDSFSDDLVPEEAKGPNLELDIPDSTKVHFIGLGLSDGVINFRDHLVDGLQFNISTRYGFASSEGTKSFYQADLEFKYYKSIFGDHTFAQRIKGGATNTDSLQYWSYLGGLDSIRGFADNRFSGLYYWLSNTEYRYPLWESSNFTLQAVGFLDVVGVADEISRVANLTGASAGAGLRVFLPKVYRFVVRLDFAKPLKRNDDNAISFGVQQFF